MASVVVTLQLLFSSALGAALQLLFASVCEAAKKVADLESNLSSLKSTLESINVAFLHINHTQRETEAFVVQLIKGQELICKGSTVKWNIFKRLHYSSKIKSFEASILKFFQNDVAAFSIHETTKISEVVLNLDEKINEIATVMRQHIVSKEVDLGRVCVSDTVVGFDCEGKEIQEIKNLTENMASGSRCKDNINPEPFSR